MPQYSVKLNCPDYKNFICQDNPKDNQSCGQLVDIYCSRRMAEFVNVRNLDYLVPMYFLMDDEIKEEISNNDFDWYTVSYARHYNYNDCFAARCYILCKDQVDLNTLKLMFGEYIIV